MHQLSMPLPEIKNLSDLKSDKSEKVNSNHNLFKPPKYGSEIFYYTEIPNEWLSAKK